MNDARVIGAMVGGRVGANDGMVEGRMVPLLRSLMVVGEFLRSMLLVVVCGGLIPVR
jgi:hypothetical protein